MQAKESDAGPDSYAVQWFKEHIKDLYAPYKGLTNCMASLISRKGFVLTQKNPYSLFKKICMLRWII